MNIEELTKSQIILLTLLVSFVTSIATGIVTVSLMDQAPPAIAQTVNRVIERTIETVTPASQAASVVTRTVVVRETELISEAVTKVSPSIVRLYATTSDSAPILGLGVVLTAEGFIASDSSVTPDSIIVVLGDGARAEASVVSRDENTGIAFFKVASTTAITWKPATVTSNTPILGQTIVALTGRSVARIEDGIVTALIPLGEESSHSVIDTNVSADAILPGTPLLNVDGQVIGVSTKESRASSPKGFVASSALMAESEGRDESEAPAEE